MTEQEWIHTLHTSELQGIINPVKDITGIFVDVQDKIVRMALAEMIVREEYALNVGFNTDEFRSLNIGFVFDPIVL